MEVLILADLLDEMVDGIDVFETGLELKSGVDVDADALRMLDGLDGLNIIGTNAATQEERCFAVVRLEDVPLEFFPSTANGFALRVKEEIIDHTLIILAAQQVFF